MGLVVQFFLSPLLLARGYLGVVLSNLLYAGSLSYYHYTQFLGYSGAPAPLAFSVLIRLTRLQLFRFWSGLSCFCTLLEPLSLVLA